MSQLEAEARREIKPKERTRKVRGSRITVCVSLAGGGERGARANRATDGVDTEGNAEMKPSSDKW